MFLTYLLAETFWISFLGFTFLIFYHKDKHMLREKIKYTYVNSLPNNIHFSFWCFSRQSRMQGVDGLLPGASSTSVKMYTKTCNHVSFLPLFSGAKTTCCSLSKMKSFAKIRNYKDMSHEHSLCLNMIKKLAAQKWLSSKLFEIFWLKLARAMKIFAR